jgi:hypothetical protein
MIPHIIHQIWIGPKPVPERFIDSWRQHPGWEHWLWREADLEALDMTPTTRAIWKRESLLHSRSNLGRYEILLKHGGVYIDADSLWLGTRRLEEYSDGVSMFAGYEGADYPGIGRLICGGTMGSEPGFMGLQHVVQVLAETYDDWRKTDRDSWKASGPGLLTRAMTPLLGDPRIKAYPSSEFYPQHWAISPPRGALGTSAEAAAREHARVFDEATFRRTYPTHLLMHVGYTTNSLKAMEP